MSNIYIRTDDKTKEEYTIAIEKVKKTGHKITQSEQGEILIRKWTKKVLFKKS